MLNIRGNDGHVRFYVANDADNAPCLWADTAHPAHTCTVCASDTRFMWGPAVVLIKPGHQIFGGTEPAVWSASCAVLLNRTTAEPVA